LVLLHIAHDPGVRLRDIAARTGITGRAYSTVTDLTEAGLGPGRRFGCGRPGHDRPSLPLPLQPA
jgi:hypothetical protein